MESNNKDETGSLRRVGRIVGNGPAKPKERTADELGERLPDILRNRRNKKEKKKTARLVSALVLGVFSLGGGIGWGAYQLGRTEVIAQVQTLLDQLGLRKPIQTEGFLLSARDTLVLDARIDRRSIHRVVFRPLPGEEHVLYEADEPQAGFEDVRAEHKYSLHDPWAGKRVTAEVEFVPFDDLPEDLLPSAENLVRRREILITNTLGLVLDPASTEAVRLDMPEQLTMSEEELYHVHGLALADGAVYVLVRAVGAGQTVWNVQNYGRGTEVRAGQLFTVESFFVQAEQFEVMAILVPSASDWPFPPGQTEIKSIPSSEHRFGPVRVTVTRPK